MLTWLQKEVILAGMLEMMMTCSHRNQQRLNVNVQACYREVSIISQETGAKIAQKTLWTAWLINGQDLAPTLWKYRERTIDAAQRVAPLTSSVEKL